MTRIVLSAAALAAMAGCAPAPQTGVQTANPGRDCFNVRAINGFSAVDRDTVRIKVGVDDYYDVETFGTCTDLEWTRVVGIRAEPDNFICAGDNFGDVFTEESNCAIRNISRAPMSTAGADLQAWPPEG